MTRKKREILVSVVYRADRKHLVYRWADRVADTSGEETTGTSSKRTARAADRMAAFVESIKARRVPKPVDPTWEVFRARYERSKKTIWRPKTMAAWVSAVKPFERIVAPEYLSDFGEAAIDEFRVGLHGQVAPSTVDSYLRSLRVATKWAARIYPEYTAPVIVIGKAPSKGRPLVEEEFDRMLDTCATVAPNHAGSWRFLLRGLAWSGLRLQQALDLSWEIEAPIHVENLDGPHPLIQIAYSDHKGKRQEPVAIVPPMAAILRQVPLQQRTGHVFNPKNRRGTIRDLNAASDLICKIGEKAGIVTGTRLKRKKNKATGKMEVVGTVSRFAGAHDLKRTFVERLLALGFHPAKIAQLAQHRTFDVTQHHYAGHDVRQLSEYAQGLFDAAETET